MFLLLHTVWDKYCLTYNLLQGYPHAGVTLDFGHDGPLGDRLDPVEELFGHTGELTRTVLLGHFECQLLDVCSADYIFHINFLNKVPRPLRGEVLFLGVYFVRDRM